MAKHWFEIRNAASETDPVEILIYDQIGKSFWDDSGVGAKEFAQALKEIPHEKEIVVAINSPGGNVFDGLAIYHQLQARQSKVVTRVDGLAASIASVIAMAGRETRMPKNALLMIHDPSALAIGNAADMRKMADVLDKNKSVLVGIYHAKTGKPTAEIEKEMTAETWFTGPEAKDGGYIDTVTDQVSIANDCDLAPFHFRHIQSIIIDSAAPLDSKPKSEMSTTAAKPETVQETPLTLLERLKNLLAPADDKKELTDLRVEVNRLTGELTTLKTENSTLKEAGKTKPAEVEVLANAKAAETLAKAGHSAVNAEDPAKAKDAAKSATELWAEYKTINDKDGPRAAREFYIANKARM